MELRVILPSRDFNLCFYHYNVEPRGAELGPVVSENTSSDFSKTNLYTPKERPCVHLKPFCFLPQPQEEILSPYVLGNKT